MSAEIWHKAHDIASAQIERIRSGSWGGGHEPNPGLAAAIANFAIEQVNAERDACAKIAERMGYEGDFDDEGSRIAKAIRDRNA